MSMFSVYDSLGEPVKTGFSSKKQALTFITIMGRYDWKIK